MSLSSCIYVFIQVKIIRFFYVLHVLVESGTSRFSIMVYFINRKVNFLCYYKTVILGPFSIICKLPWLVAVAIAVAISLPIVVLYCRTNKKF